MSCYFLAALFLCLTLIQDSTSTSLRGHGDALASLGFEERQLEAEVRDLKDLEAEIRRRDEEELVRRSWNDDNHVRERSADEEEDEWEDSFEEELDEKAEQEALGRNAKAEQQQELARKAEADQIALNEEELVKRSWAADNHMGAPSKARAHRQVLRQTPLPYQPRYTPAQVYDLVNNNGDFIVRLPNTPAPYGAQEWINGPQRQTPPKLRQTPGVAEFIQLRPTPAGPAQFGPGGPSNADVEAMMIAAGWRPNRRGLAAGRRAGAGSRREWGA